MPFGKKRLGNASGRLAKSPKSPPQNSTSPHNPETTAAHRPHDYNARRLRLEAVAAGRHVPSPRATPNPKPFPHGRRRRRHLAQAPEGLLVRRRRRRLLERRGERQARGDPQRQLPLRRGARLLPHPPHLPVRRRRRRPHPRLPGLSLRRRLDWPAISCKKCFSELRGGCFGEVYLCGSTVCLLGYLKFRDVLACSYIWIYCFNSLLDFILHLDRFCMTV